MTPKVIFLAGAPTSRSLDWDESHLLSDFTDPFIQFLRLSNSAPRNNNAPSFLESPTAPNPAWRELPLERQHLTTGASQDHAFQPIYGGNGNHDQDVDEALSHFYEHSYAIHADAPSSQITPHASFTSMTSSEAGASSSASTSHSVVDSHVSLPPSGDHVESVGHAPPIPVAGHCTSLKDVPHAQYLSSIVPQTMTVNLIVGIISIAEPRAIDTRRGGEVALVEMLVGDETKSGFSINFWLSGRGKEGVRRSLEDLRVQDVVLVRNVALGSFNGKVHGQSLRKDMTRFCLLYREKIDRKDVGGCYGKRDLEGEELDGQLAKVRRVRSWVEGFVGVVKPLRRGVKRVREELPPDTQ
ncbi:hypothetical protein DSL72_008472 [Monilinia vaccinii-corymbosi]|uniref:Uncharacterized protein n=1 Tax=Monilinia vaccinii-corymbosi TaxID=61207 RepID=A0A8A3PJT3_9HELO|nr:hypothetical protein DSL72_008472 [Monilinia vaccinii-corymbosi]